MLVLSLVSNAAWHQAVSWFEVCMLSLRGFPGLLPQSWTRSVDWQFKTGHGCEVDKALYESEKHMTCSLKSLSGE